jgi:hypothetical protein
MVVRLSVFSAGRVLPSERSLVFISFRGWADHRAIVRLEGLGQLRYAMTWSEIEPATFRLVEQYFNQPPQYKLKLSSMVWVRERTIPTERPPLVGEVSANFCG